MTKFYTSVERSGSYILWRGYDNDKRFSKKVKFEPSLFLETTKEEEPEFVSLIGGFPLKRRKLESMNAAKDFIERYKDVSGMTIYGTTNYVTQFIQEQYPSTIRYDIGQMNIVSFDIEIDISDGLADMDIADKTITAISYKSSRTNTYYLLGLKDYDKYQTTIEGLDPDVDIVFFKADSEAVLLKRFLSIWTSDYPDVVTGWNCIPVGQSVWGKDKIYTIETAPEALFASTKVASSPISRKSKYIVKLATGREVYSSGDHKFFVRQVPKGAYTKLGMGGKSKAEDHVLPAKAIITEGKESFVPVMLRRNDNHDNIKYTDKQLYLAGLVFTDGSLKDRNNPKWGYNIYQKDKDFLTSLGVNDNVYGSEVKGYGVYVNPSHISGAHELIYDGADKKLNVAELSTLSERQFYAFLSGMLDGDGCCSVSDGGVSVCNYDGHCENIAELCQWNGIFTTISGAIVRLVDLDIKKTVVRHKRFGNYRPKSSLKHTSAKSEQIKYRLVDGVYYVRVTSVIDTGEMVDMMDIETSDQSFVSMGVKVHNCKLFDITYIVRRISAVLGEEQAKSLSPWGILQKKTEMMFGREQDTFKIYGMGIVDMMDAFKKFGYKYGKQESYKLDHIANVVLDEKKIDYSEYGTLSELYDKNPQLYLDYALKDTVLLQRIEDESGLVSLVIQVAYGAGINFEDSFGTVGPWESILYRWQMERGIVHQVKNGVGDELGELVGGYVKEPSVGFTEWVVSLDYASLYPHIMICGNMSPETLLKDERVYCNVDLVVEKKFKRPDDGYARMANGAAFSKDALGMIPTIIKEYYAQRKSVKNEMLRYESELESIGAELKKRGIKV